MKPQSLRQNTYFQRGINLAHRFGLIGSARYASLRFNNIDIEHAKKIVSYVRSINSNRIRFSTTACITFVSNDSFNKIALTSKAQKLLQQEHQGALDAYSCWNTSRVRVTIPEWQSNPVGKTLKRDYISATEPSFNEAFDLWSRDLFKHTEGQSCQFNDLLPKEDFRIDLGEILDPRSCAKINELLKSSWKAGPMHGDATCKNILQSENGFAIIDWDRFRIKGIPEIDGIHLCVTSLEQAYRTPWPQILENHTNKERLTVDKVKTHPAHSALANFTHKAIITYALFRFLVEYNAANHLSKKWLKSIKLHLPIILSNDV